jgi:hypothetical protein
MFFLISLGFLKSRNCQTTVLLNTFIVVKQPAFENRQELSFSTLTEQVQINLKRFSNYWYVCTFIPIQNDILHVLVLHIGHPMRQSDTLRGLKNN